MRPQLPVAAASSGAVRPARVSNEMFAPCRMSAASDFCFSSRAAATNGVTALLVWWFTSARFQGPADGGFVTRHTQDAN